ncbi:hypothetical protein [Methyloterricola oryzae]|uniref:hypothetical protein n=1 Tax=Methyloterricola oryzae TaxID=1495050 RepID=UPI0011AF1979|nr:hypothetical protein [Methyloterricola oryzae]
MVPIRTVVAASLIGAVPAFAADSITGIEKVVYVGPKHVPTVDGSNDMEEFYHEAGTLDCKDGFVPITHSTFSVLVATNGVPNAAGAEQASGYKAVSDLTLETLANYMADSKAKGFNKCFRRSADTYSFTGISYLQDNIPYVAVLTSTSPPSYTSVSAIEASIPEGSSGEFLIALNKPSWRTVTVRYKVSGTAKNGKDFKRLSGKAKILAGNISTIVKVTSRKDQVTETVEQITIDIKPSKKYQLSGATSATMQISD